MKPLPLGSTIGFLGGGQLAKMLAVAANSMGYKTIFLEPDPEAPAGSVSQHIQAAYADEAALAQLAEAADVVTLEFENVPEQVLNTLSQKVAVYPRPELFKVSRNRILEKETLNKAGLATAPYVVLTEASQLKGALDAVGGRGILKTAEMGYDGKGQKRVSTEEELKTAFLELNTACVLEGLVPFSAEVSVQVARSASGYLALSGIVENVHQEGILRRSLFPARVSEEVAQTALTYAKNLAEYLNLVGLLTLELFVLPDNTVLVNEIAPRVHNSGHLTLNAGGISQFEAQIRAVCDLPQLDFAPLLPAAMVNVLGWDKHEPEWDAFLGIEGAHLHMYGKKNRAGRKLGHVNIAHFDPNILFGSTKLTEMLLYGDSTV